MARPKKDGERISLFFSRDLLIRLRSYADKKGQTLTTAIERMVEKCLDETEQENSKK